MSNDSKPAADRGSELTYLLGPAPWDDDVESWLEASNAEEIADDIRRWAMAEAARLVTAERERCANEVPSNWLDPLLTGPRSLVRATDDCQMVERLLSAVRGRIREA